jgi:preprotein translocase subunit SecG
MSLIVTLLTIVLVLDCAVLILLILMQLPKKEAGLGQAFGSSATDALFGSGSGNALTKTTKYAAALFFALALLLTILGPRLNEDRRRQKEFETGSSGKSPKSQVTPASPASLLGTNLLTAATNVPVEATKAPASTNK